jgi:hypothetical protein
MNAALTVFEASLTRASHVLSELIAKPKPQVFSGYEGG